MTTKQMEYILELSQTLNYNRAAENLFISQSTLTYHIQEVEKEICFPIFYRSGKGVSLTPAGSQFCLALRTIREDLKRAIEQGQNFSTKYQKDIGICLPLRSALYFLPDAIIEFYKKNTSTSITPIFLFQGGIDLFLRGECDILFAYADDLKRIPDIKIHSLYDSHIYLIAKKDDPLAHQSLVTMNDLSGRTLMVGGGSPPPLQAVQHRILRNIPLQYFNSHDHDTTLTNIASGRGICLAPGFLNDHNNEFAWIPFDCSETIPCVLCSHSYDKRQETQEFIQIIQELYRKKEDFPL